MKNRNLRMSVADLELSLVLQNTRNGNGRD
jgi:hypothetical protein